MLAISKFPEEFSNAEVCCRAPAQLWWHSWAISLSCWLRMVHVQGYHRDDPQPVPRTTFWRVLLCPLGPCRAGTEEEGSKTRWGWSWRCPVLLLIQWSCITPGGTKFVKLSSHRRNYRLRVLYRGQLSYLRKSVDFLKSVMRLVWLRRISSLTFYKPKCPRESNVLFNWRCHPVCHMPRQKLATADNSPLGAGGWVAVPTSGWVSNCKQ